MQLKFKSVPRQFRNFRLLLVSLLYHISLCHASRGRLRFSCHEDMHNTLKNRGFDAKHDYAGSDPNCMVIWKMLMFVALAIDQLFSFTILGIEAKGTRSWMKFARDLLQQLVEVSWQTIVASPVLKKAKVQFRFMFGIPSG